MPTTTNTEGQEEGSGSEEEEEEGSLRATPEFQSPMSPEVPKHMKIIAKYTFRDSDEEISDDDDQEEAPPQVEEEDYDEEEEAEAIMKQMTGSMTGLPLEIIFDILSGLPIKTLSQSCRWVSKSWFKIVCHPRFAQTQLAKARKSFTPCVTYWEPFSKSFWLVDHDVFDTHGTSTTAYNPKISGFGWAFDVVGACNGLICMHPDPLCYKPAPYFVFNPITRQSMSLPKSPKYKHTTRMSGFGFNPVANEYKVVRILKSLEVEIYTLGSPGWRRTSNFPHDFGLEPVFLSGALHWCFYNEGEKVITIFALDMTTEEFREIPPPPCVVEGKTYTARPVGVLGGCLCFADTDFPEHSEIWVMKTYGVQGSWSKEYIVRKGCIRWNDAYEVIKLENGELLFQQNKGHRYGEMDLESETDSEEETEIYYKQDLLQYYDPNRKVFQPILTNGIPSFVWSLRPLIHVGSLISPKNVGRSKQSLRKKGDDIEASVVRSVDVQVASDQVKLSYGYAIYTLYWVQLCKSYFISTLFL